MPEMHLLKTKKEYQKSKKLKIQDKSIKVEKFASNLSWFMENIAKNPKYHEYQHGRIPWFIIFLIKILLMSILQLVLL